MKQYNNTGRLLVEDMKSSENRKNEKDFQIIKNIKNEFSLKVQSVSNVRNNYSVSTHNSYG